jgi:hypothetical protein
MQPHPCEALLEYQNQQGSCVAEQLIAEQLIAEDKPKTSMRRQEAHTPPTLQTTPCDTVKYSTEQVHKKNNIHHKPLAEQTLPTTRHCIVVAAMPCKTSFTSKPPCCYTC